MTNKTKNYTLRAHQQKALDRVLNNPRTILALAPGLGKTLVAICATVETSSRTLVIVPAFLKDNWEKEIKTFAPESNHLFTITTYTKLNKFLEENKDILEQYEIVCLDESHYIKNRNAQRSILAHHLIKTIAPKKTIFLTGTPLKNKIPEFYSQLLALSYGEGFSFPKGYEKFCATFCNIVMRRIGYKEVKSFEGLKNADLLKQVIAPVYFTVKKEDILDMPKVVRKTINLGLKTDATLKDLLDEHDHFSTAKKENALEKAVFGLEYIKNLYEQVGKLIVFSDHPEALEIIAESFNDALVIDGQTCVDKRQALVELFNSRDEAIILCSIGAASVGLNLQSASHMVFNDYPFVPGDLSQAEGRTERIGQKGTCFYHYLVSGPMDELILEKIQSKRDIIGGVL